MSEKEEKKSIQTVLTIIGMVAASMVFLFASFQTKTEAEHQNQNQAKNLDELDQKVNSLHQDLRDIRTEMNTKLDALLQGHNDHTRRNP